MRTPSLFCFLLLFSALSLSAGAQERDVESIPNQPSPEAYDLLKDSRGYIWVAHDLGISRYDGVQFITLQHPQQSSISMTDLIEDKWGRIWCHNFSGQIFYIKDMQLHLLEEFKYQDEQGFSRIVICGDELVATSVKGLFVYNLVTAKANYFTIPQGTSTLTKVNNKVIAHGPSGWHCYEAGKAPTQLTAHLPIPQSTISSLQNFNQKDTFYLVANMFGMYCKLTLENNTAKVHAAYKTGEFINTISKDGKTVWVNTKERSFSTDGKSVIKGMSLSDVITDNQGNRWMSSLKKGLCVQYNTQPLRKIKDSLFRAGHNIRRMYAHGNHLFLGDANGRLYKLFAPTSVQYLLSLPKPAGAIERIALLDENKILLAASVGSYSYNLKTHELKQLPVNITVKDVVSHNDSSWFATTTGVKFFTSVELTTGTHRRDRYPLANKKSRCRSIAFYNGSLYAAYSDGVFRLHNQTLEEVRYNGAPIYATTIRTVDGKLLLATHNQGLLIFHNGLFTNLSEKEGLASNLIKDIKPLPGATWLIYTDRFQALKPDMTGAEEFTYPFSKGGINDFALLNKQLYISTGDGVFTAEAVRPDFRINSTTYIDKITVNGKELLKGDKLRHYQNHLQFHVSTPYYAPYSKLTYQYRIKNAPNGAWQRGAPDQFAFTLVALEPGWYEIEVVATDESRKIISQPATFQFEILPPWHQTWVFRITAGLLVVALGIYTVWLYYRRRLHKQRQAYIKQLAIQEERQRISAEIHDDIGAGLLAMRLLTEMTHNKLPEGEARQEVGRIHASITELSHKMREVIWSLNTDNDHLENLLFYIRRQAVSLFENSPVTLKIEFPKHDIPPVIIHGQKRRHIYLAVKEALHNCLKHSHAQHCFLGIRIEGNILYISVADDGRGFAAIQKEHPGNGLPGMQKRMQQIKGVLEIETKERTVVQFMVPLTERV